MLQQMVQVVTTGREKVKRVGCMRFHKTKTVSVSKWQDKACDEAKGVWKQTCHFRPLLLFERQPACAHLQRLVAQGRPHLSPSHAIPCRGGRDRYGELFRWASPFWYLYCRQIMCRYTSDKPLTSHLVPGDWWYFENQVGRCRDLF